MPYLVENVDAEAEFIMAISKLTDKELPETATVPECKQQAVVGKVDTTGSIHSKANLGEGIMVDRRRITMPAGQRISTTEWDPLFNWTPETWDD